VADLSPEEMARVEALPLPRSAFRVVSCAACKLQRYARLSPACVNHLGDLLEALADWEGTMQELDHAINVACWPNMKGDPDA
jgi:hypothetical protein